MDLISQLNGSLKGRYSIERELGVGGTATVFLAEDLKHRRKVALKVLKPELAAVLGGERFVQEIATTASLQHPHILALFDSGTADGFLFYVMPWIQGETLREKLGRETQLGVDEAVRIAREVADALEYAHQHGIVHRDIKPENILLHGGHAMVADFGIALAVSAAAGGRMTETGLSLGTPHYMSPEQATAEKEITARSDVYSLGSVLFEMLAGQPPHVGGSAQQVIMKIIVEPVEALTKLRKSVPPNVAAAVAKSLEKLPADRFESAKAFGDALGNPAYTNAGGTGTVASSDGGNARTFKRLFIGASVLAAALFVTTVVLARRHPAAGAMRPVHFVIATSDSERPVDNNEPWPATVSPDGGTVVYIVGQGRAAMLYALRTDQLDAHPIPGTSGAGQPIFSPDGQWLAFEVPGPGGKLKKVRLNGSAPIAITDANSENGADWTVGDELVVGSEGTRHGLSHVSAAGGELVEFTKPATVNGETDHLWPIALPDGQTIVFTIYSGALPTSQLAITSLADGKVTPLGLKGIRPLAVLDDKLVYVQADGQVMAVPLDTPRRRVAGKPVPVADPVNVVLGLDGNSGIFVSRGGALVESRGASLGQLAWVARDGVSHPIVRESREYFAPRLSPDGRRIAVGIGSPQHSDIWTYDLSTTTLARLTSLDGAASPEWTPDGKRVVFIANGKVGKTAIWSQPADGGSPAEQLLQPADTPLDVAVSPDGKELLFAAFHVNNYALFRLRLDSARAARGYIVTPQVNYYVPRFSPDGRWVALVSSESGRNEVYMRSFPDPGVRVPVSTGGGRSPVWSADGRRLYYWDGEVLVEAKLAVSPVVRVLSRDTVLRVIREGVFLQGHADYDVARDGRVLRRAGSGSGLQLVVMPNWLDELRERTAHAMKK
jgi:serine/threonine-protein kinase